jgi:transcriptional regulator with XRE-family HTH domain
MKKEIGQRLKLVREKKDLSQADLGDKLGIQYQHVSKYERGESVPTWEYLIKLNEIYGVNINWLLTGNGIPFLSGEYPIIEDTEKQTIRDKDSTIDEIVAVLEKDAELKVLIYEYVQHYESTKKLTAALKLKTNDIFGSPD